MAMDLRHVPKRNTNIVWQDLAGEAVLLNPRTGEYFGLDQVACSFWEKADGSKSLEKIVFELVDEYEVEKEVLIGDLQELIDRMLPFNLIVLE